MMCVGMFMAILDVQVVATSLPTIQSALNIPPGIVNLLSEARDDAEMARPGYAAIWTPAMSFHAFSASARSAR